MREIKIIRISSYKTDLKLFIDKKHILDFNFIPSPTSNCQIATITEFNKVLKYLRKDEVKVFLKDFRKIYTKNMVLLFFSSDKYFKKIQNSIPENFIKQSIRYNDKYGKIKYVILIEIGKL